VLRPVVAGLAILFDLFILVKVVKLLFTKLNYKNERKIKMNRIKLKNQNIYKIEATSSEFELLIQLSSIEELTDTYKSFTDENLSEYEILNDADQVTALYINKKLECINNIHEVENGIEITVKLSNVDATELRIKGLEAKIDELINTK